MDNKELAEQWQKLPHRVAEIVEKMIYLNIMALPSREDIGDNSDMLKLRGQ